jgi:signal transduction histidine kinase/FixJ family two-component response regulator
VGLQTGLLHLCDRPVVPFSSKEGLAMDRVWGVAPRLAGGVWACTDQGISWIDGRACKNFRAAGGRAIRVYTALDGDPLLAGTTEGLMELRGGVLRPSPLGRAMVHAYVYAILREGNVLWVGTSLGLHRIGPGGDRLYAKDDGLPSEHIKCLLRARDGRFWVGTKAGIGLLDPAADRFIPGPDILGGLYVTCLREDSGGRLWVGSDKGLFLLQGATCRSLGRAAGLLDVNIDGVAEDGRGDLWISTLRGILRIRKADLAAYLDGTRLVLSPRIFPPDCNGGTQSSIARSRDGALWFPTLGGAFRLDPERIHVDSLPPPLAIEEVLVNGEVRKGALAPGGREAAFKADTRHLEFHYTALSLEDPAKVRFRYHLDGLDREWVEAGARRTAYYNSLAPGHYVFRVAACNADGVWCETQATFAFRVQPHFYQTVWFGALVLLAALGGLLAAHRLRVRHLHHREVRLNGLVERRTRDLTLRTSQLEASEMKAREASLAKSTFLANMSHELRTPMNVILGFAQVMQRDPGLPKGQREHLDRILRSGEHLMSLINDVLSISKIEAGKLILNPSAFALRPMLRGVSEMIEARASEKGLEWGVSVDASVPETVETDEGKLRQVLLNLLGNAVKFTAAGEVGLRVAREGGLTVFEVRDTGAGMSPEEAAGLFGAFVQAEAGRHAGEGTGLGLHISQAMVRLMGGEITVQSTPGKGTRFHFALPLTEAGLVPAPQKEGIILGLEAGPQARALVADDRADNRILLREVLEGWGLEVAEASDGRETLEVWEAEPVGIVCLDLRMPVMSGLEAAREIRRREAATGRTRTVILALSASVLETDRTEVLAAGFDDYILKPFRESDLASALERHGGLRFRRAETRPEAAPALSASDFQALPGDWVAAFRRCLRLGDADEARSLLPSLGRPDLAQKLEQFLEAFRFEDLLDLTERGEDLP